MSDEEVTIETTDQMLTAEYKDGQLQIVEVSPYEKNNMTSNLTNLDEETHNQAKYMQVLDSNKGGMLQLDLVNLTLVRCENEGESYRIITNEGVVSEEATEETTDDTVTCILQSSDTEAEQDNQESYVLVNDQSEDGPLVYMQSSLQQTNISRKEDTKNKPLTPAEIIERAKALQKVKTLISQSTSTSRGGRKRKSDLPPPHELLSSPNFKLYLYSCKLCSFKCNAIKEMSAHKAAEHANKSRVCNGKGQAITLQCARCPFRGTTHTQLVTHVQDTHVEANTDFNKVQLDTEEVQAADVLVCGACGYESSSRFLFKRHIEDQHGATTC